MQGITEDLNPAIKVCQMRDMEEDATVVECVILECETYDSVRMEMMYGILIEMEHQMNEVIDRVVRECMVVVLVLCGETNAHSKDDWRRDTIPGEMWSVWKLKPVDGRYNRLCFSLFFPSHELSL